MSAAGAWNCLRGELKLDGEERGHLIPTKSILPNRRKFGLQRAITYVLAEFLGRIVQRGQVELVEAEKHGGSMKMPRVLVFQKHNEPPATGQ